MNTFEKQRKQMVATQIRWRGVTDELVLSAMRNVRRESFALETYRNSAYSDRPLPIGENQTISQPFMVAYMVEALGLKGGEKVLEVGAGSGYAAAVLAEIVDQVYAIERILQLSRNASANLTREGYRNVHLLHSDGTLGWEEHAPFDAILVSAAASEIPTILRKQLIVGGHMVVPVGIDPHFQKLLRLTRGENWQFEVENLGNVGFVPLIGSNSG